MALAQLHFPPISWLSRISVHPTSVLLEKRPTQSDPLKAAYRNPLKCLERLLRMGSS